MQSVQETATPLCTMRWWGNNLPALKILVANGGDITIEGLDGNTPLEKAIDENKSGYRCLLKEY